MFQVRYLHKSARVLATENHYHRLKLPYDATASDIKSRFKKLSLRLHPDMLKSQGLSKDELDKKTDEYLKIKKSYETLSDDTKKSEYDVQMGFKKRAGTSQNSFLRRANTFHFHEKYHNNDVPHFDIKKHAARNERLEKYYNYHKKMSQDIDRFGRNLYARNLGTTGPRKGIYREYKHQPNIRDDEAEGKKIAIKVGSALLGFITLVYLLTHNYSTKNNNKKVSNIESTVADTNVGTIETKDDKNTASKSGKTMSVNNDYGKMLLGGSAYQIDNMEVLEEQISEAAE